MVLAAGVALGQVLGGLLVTVDLAGLGWRPIFLVSVPVGLVLLLAAPAKLPPAPGRAGSSLDLPGVLTLGVAMVLVVLPLTFGAELSWPRWAWLCLAGGAVAAGCFVAVELAALRGGRQPLLDLRALLAPGVAPGLLVVLATMAGYGGLLFSISQHLQVGLGFTPLAAGLTFAAYAAGFAAVSVRWSRLAPRVQRWLPTAGLLALAAADAVLATRLAASTWSPALVVLLALAGGGHAAAFGPLVAQIAHRLDAERAPAFSALVTTTVQIAVVVGVAGLGSLYLGAARAGGPAASGHALALVCAAVAAISLLGLSFSLRVAGLPTAPPAACRSPGRRG
jgi:predicted MFS family arabinose efflux permease